MRCVGVGHLHCTPGLHIQKRGYWADTVEQTKLRSPLRWTLQMWPAGDAASGLRAAGCPPHMRISSTCSLPHGLTHQCVYGRELLGLWLPLPAVVPAPAHAIR
jgi:hypothetical protein